MDFGVTQQGEVLHCVLAKASSAQDEHALAFAEERQGVADGAESRQATTTERGRIDRVEVAERKDVAAVRHEHVLGIAALVEQAGLVAVGADHLGACRAEATVAAAPGRVDEDVAVLFGPAGHLVSERHRARLFAKLAVGDMDIGEADATGRDLDDDLIVALGNGDLDLVKVQGSIALV